jgi:hypothetical protein
MTTVWHYGSIRAGLAFVPAPVIAIPAAIVAGHLSTSRRTLATIGSVLWGAGVLLWFVSLSDQPGYATDLFPGTLLCGRSAPRLVRDRHRDHQHLPPGRFGRRSGLGGHPHHRGRVLGDYRTIWLYIVACGAIAALFSIGTGADRT